MNSLKIKLIYLCCCLAFFKAIAQPTNSQIRDAVMPPPTAASLGKYGDIPVSYHTGVPSIGISIYTMKEGSLSLPISLSYHAGGVKVGEPASWVGLGWSLQAGGMISRTVLGKPDESCGGYFATASEIVLTNGCLPLTLNGELSNAAKDGEPDLFSFSIGGYNGKFYIDKNDPTTPSVDGKVVLIPKQDLKVEYHLDNSSCSGTTRLRAFTITTPDGTKYEFGNIDNSSNKKGLEMMENNDNNFSQASGWHLRRIISADAVNVINLDYVSEKYRYGYRSRPGGMVLPPTAPWATPSTKYFENVVDMEGWRLSTITTSTATATFIAATNRQDLLNNVSGSEAKELDKIKIESGTFCKTFDLQQTYYEDNSALKAGNTATQHNADKRLKLLSVQEKSCDDTPIIIPPHIFEYNEDLTTPTFMPNRYSSAIDHWGYYNGATSNPTSDWNIPYTPFEYSYPIVGGTKNIDVWRGNSNREANESFMKLGTIKKITYPTGGTSSFELEANQVYDTDNYWDFVNIASVATSSWPNAYCGQSQAPINSINVTFTQAQIDNLYYEWEAVGSCPTNFCVNVPSSAQLQIYQGNTQICNGGSTPVTCGNFTPVKAGNRLTKLIPNCTLNAGVTYTFKLTGYNMGSIFTLKQKVQKQRMGNRTVGGLRIKKITTNDGNGNNTIKSYDYQNNGTQSSGVYISKPSYGTIFQGIIGNCNGSILAGSYSNHFWMDNTVVPLANFEGFHMGYRYVKEYNHDIFDTNASANNIGFTVYSYWFDPPSPPFSTSNTPLPLIPVQPNVDNGNLYQKEIKNVLNTTISSEINNIYPDTYENSQGLFIRFNHYDGVGFWKDYRIRTKPFRLASTISTIDNITTTTNYTYASTSHLQPTEVSITNSDGKVTKTQTDYSWDVTNTAVLDANTKTALKNAFILTPIETRSYVGTTQVGGSRTTYKLFDNATGGTTTSTSSSFPRPYQFLNYETTWDQMSGNTPTLQTGNWVSKGTIDYYWGTNQTISKAGMPRYFTKTGWLQETYNWNTAGLITQRQYKDFTWKYAYLPSTALVSTITNVDGQQSTYTYDKLMRLESSNARSGAVKTEYAYNYPSTTRPTIYANVKTTQTFGLTTPKVLESFTYVDGLGRTVQSVAKGKIINGTSTLDQVAAVEYDKYGRAYKQYEPFASTLNTGARVATIPTAAAANFTLSEFELSPLSRTIGVTPPSWYKTITSYGTNVASDVKNYNFINNANTFYAANELIRTTVQDANGNFTHSFKDKKGRLVLMRKTDSAAANKTETYYVYDDKDRLVRVITPGSTVAVSEDLDYRYEYYGNDLIAKKKVPGKAIEQFQYNLKDLPALYQDGFLRDNAKWMATSYDDYGRMLVKGINSNWDKDNLTFTNKILENIYGTTAFEQDKLKTSKVMIMDAEPVVNPTAANPYLTKNLTYDSYGRVSNMTSNLNTNRTSAAAESMTYTYDVSDNITTESRLCAHGAGPSNIIVNTREFDTWNRLKSVSQSIDGTVTKLNYINYTEKDQVASKIIAPNAANTAGLQTVDYQYLTNGLLRSINGTSSVSSVWNPLSDMLSNFNTPTFTSTTSTEDLFREDLEYDAPTMTAGLQGIAQKNGNISQVSWRVKGRGPMAYGYTYDYLDRMTDAKFSSYSISATLLNNNYFNEKPIYDARGNITSLQRQGMLKGTANFTNVQIDNLTYTYKAGTNQIDQIADAANVTEGFKKSTSTAQYLYDTNGNMKFDPNKNLTITYNHLNLPSKFTFGIASDGNNIEILYDATGQKLRKTVKTLGAVTLTQDYISGIELKNNRLESIYNEEGRAYNTTNATQAYPYNWRREYNLKDHLGNTRVVFCDKNNNGVINDQTEILQETHYYPFGMSFNGAWYADATASKNKYLYNGKELNEDFGLNLSDYGARWYDAAVGRWWSTDPLAEKTRRYTPYHYGKDNPVRFIDPDGMMATAFDEMREQSKKEQADNVARSSIMDKIDKALNGGPSLKGGSQSVVGSVVDMNSTKKTAITETTTSISESAEQRIKTVTTAIDMINEKGTVEKSQFVDVTTTVENLSNGKVISKMSYSKDMQRSDYEKEFVSKLNNITTSLSDYAKNNGKHFLDEHFDKVTSFSRMSTVNFGAQSLLLLPAITESKLIGGILAGFGLGSDITTVQGLVDKMINANQVMISAKAWGSNSQVHYEQNLLNLPK